MKVLLHPAAQAQIEAVLSHPGGSFLLHGESGVGKRTAALEIARRLNCDGCQDESCRHCRMVTAGNHPDVTRVDPDEKGKIGIAQIQQLHHVLQYEAYEAGSHRVVIIANAEVATIAAQNALLKVLEEPPSLTTIILTSTSLTALLPTILSRCIKVYLPVLEQAEIIAHLRTVYPEANAEVAASVSHGAPGRALRYARDPNELATKRQVHEKVKEFLQTGSLFERLQFADSLAAQSDNRAAILHELGYAVRKQARSQPASQMLQAVESLQQRLKSNVNPKTAFEALAVELR